jgi:uncharacterized repeat protein (TIGR03803 family)
VLALGAVLAAPASAATAIGRAAESPIFAAHSFADHPRTFRNRRAPAETLTQVHSFSSTDGANPSGALDLNITTSARKLVATIYGETFSGGAPGNGTLYSETINSDGFTSLYSFAGTPDGSGPSGGLASGPTDYSIGSPLQLGVASAGGSLGLGTVFFTTTSGVVKVLHTFTGGADGATPLGRIAEATSGNFYGTTSAGGAYGDGTIFEITRYGGFFTVYTFTGQNDGASPLAGLAERFDAGGKANIVRNSIKSAIAAGHAPYWNQFVSPYLYGTTSTSGSGGAGTIFQFNPKTNKVVTIYGFENGADGATPSAELSSDLHDDLFGTASNGGSAGAGTVFEITRFGNFVVIHDFGFDTSGNLTSGATPLAPVTVGPGGNIYGTASAGGANDLGDVFEISSKGFTDLYDFSGPDGASPQGKLLDGLNGQLYGTTSNGGALGYGEIFSITHP